MDESILENIILNQNFGLKQKSKGFTRYKLNEINSFIKPNINIVITGPRRTGKSTLLLQIMDKYYKDGYYYLNFLDERLVDFDVGDFQKAYELFIKNYGLKKIFFFDEVQGKKGWDRFVARMYEQGFKFFITGSNSSLLSKEISTYLTARHKDVLLFPFSFKEFLDYNNIALNYKITENKINIQKKLDEYILNGGFPEVIVNKNTDYLTTIYSDVINKDVIDRYKVKYTSTFKKIGLFLLSNFSKEISYTSIKKSYELGNTNTAKKYIHYLCNSYLFFEINKFDYSLKKQESYSKKIYCVDTGLINKLGFAFSSNYGRLYENIVFLELFQNNENLYFWKDKINKEVDFVVFNKNKVSEVIQVCYNLTEPETYKRELDGLLSAIEYFKLKEGKIITKDILKTETINHKKIYFIPLYIWLIEQKENKN